MVKLTVDNMKKAHEELQDIFERKNSDYGNSFEESLDKHGLIAAIVRMEDKMNRITKLSETYAVQMVHDESIIDTLKDLSNYALMAAVWLENIEPLDSDDKFGMVACVQELRDIMFDLMEYDQECIIDRSITVIDEKTVSFRTKDSRSLRDWFNYYTLNKPGYIMVHINKNDATYYIQFHIDDEKVAENAEVKS